MWKTLSLLLIILLLFVNEIYQDVSTNKHRQSSKKASRGRKTHTNFNISGRKIEAELEKNALIINILDRPKVRHHHGMGNLSHKKGQAFVEWSSETEKKMIENIRCRRYNRGYYFTNRCTNYCNCPYLYGKYNCGPCSYRPIPTYIPPYVPPVVITCSCDPEGSLFNTCNSKGQCMCKPNYKGPKCKRCKTGYWKHPQLGCIECLCNRDGSESPNCHTDTGICTCKSGVGGDRCDACLSQYYGNITEGCQKCDPCDKEGHICDPHNGKCVCPPLTLGYKCERCSLNSWGYVSAIGCKNCSCSNTGSVKSHCDVNSGKCECKKGYEGEKCDSCSLGYYGYPICKQCTCNPSGTLENEFVNGIIRCDENGRCRCKENVEGSKCDACKPSTFGLDRSNPEGCTTCFCFGRSTRCTAIDYTWDQIHTDKLQQSRENCLFSFPCINLPVKFTGDLTLSYGGYLRIISPSASAEFFVRLTGNNVTVESTFRDDIRIDELNWRIFRTSDKLLPDCNRKLNRKCLMVILQNVSNIAVKTSSVDDIGEVLLDKAVMIPTAQRARTIEKCECPKEYTSLSCQDPNHGYYRYRQSPYDSSHTWVDRIIGVSKKCDCNGLSNTCDALTGHCLNCGNFTTGPHCEYCAEGFYRTYNSACLPCLCPTEKQNFAKNCTANTKINHFICHCKEGYTGKKCNKCDDGYFGKPQEPQGSCSRCNCNSYGSIVGNCDKATGRCQCHPNFTGIRCDQCKAARKYIRNGECTPCDECTQILFNAIDELSNQLNKTILSFEDGIQGPWKYLDAIEDRYDILKDRYAKTNSQMQIMSENVESLRKYEDKANNLYSALKKKSNQLSNQIDKIEHIKKVSDKLNADIALLRNRLNKFISSINKFGISHLNLKNSLEKAKHLLKEMDAKAKTMRSIEDYKIVFDKCNKIFHRIHNIYRFNDFNVGNITEYVDDLKMRFEDLNNLSNFVRKEAKQIKLKNKENLIKYHDLNKTISILKNRYKMIMDNIEYSKNKLNGASELIEGITKLLDKIIDTNLGNYFKLLEQKEMKYNENAAIIDQQFKNMKEHITFLNETLTNLRRQVNFTQEEWKKISAGESYENIVKGISEAKNNALEAQHTLENVDRIMNPPNNDAILTQSSLSLGLSDRLKQRIINHMNQNDLHQRLDNVKYDLENLKREMYKNGNNNNNFYVLLHDLKERLSSSKPNMEDMKQVIETATDIARNMNKIISDVNTMRYVNEHNLTRPLNKYLNLTSKENVRKLNEEIYSKINEINGININPNLNYIIDRKNEFLAKSNEHLNDIKNRILALKANITFTTQRVNNLYLPMSLSNCSRWYQLRNIGVFNSMRMKFNCSSCNLLNLSSNGQSISIRVIDGLLTLKWNQFPIELQLDKDSITSVDIRRKQNYLYCTIQNQVFEIPDKRLFHISEDDFVNVGQYFNNTTAGCLYELFFNDINIGLWNFMKSIGNCTACETVSEGTYGQGKVNTLYTEGSYTLYNVSTLNPQKFSVEFNFRTFDENSLLFLAQEKSNPCAFISLTLKNGLLEFNMRHNDNATMVSIPVTNKYNNGKGQYVNIVLQYKNNNQNYGLTVNDLSFTRDRNLLRMNVFRIRQSRYFIGGVSPEFNRSCIPVNTTSFVGFLNYQSENSLGAIMSYNTFPQIVKELNFYRSWFRGDGHLNMNTTVKYKKKIFNIYFEIHAVLNTSYIMNIEKVGKIALKNRKIIFELQNGERIDSDVDLNDILNVINITVKEQETILNVNSEDKAGGGFKLLKGDFVILNIGDDSTKEYGGFLGGISNIYIDNKNINFNRTTILDFKHVEIGRWRTPKIAEEAPTSLTITENPDNMQNTQGCFPASAYQIDPAAIKFGDRMPSYVYKRNSFWRRNFTLEMQFRTLYPSGLILISTGSQPKVQYNILEVRKGKLQYLAKGRRKPITIIFETKVDDGEWHTIIIEQQGLKKKRKMRIGLDGEWQKPTRIPKSNVRNEFYLGGVPENFTTRNLNIQQFIGCIREFKINNLPQLNTKDLSFYMNLGSCFPKVEKGAYFGGDAYAIYKRDFRVNKQLELSFEFKTSEHNGVLLTISNSGNSPALSIELQNGGVVMSVDLGNSPVFSVTNNLNSDYALCNNKWHNVTALYSMYELTVNIDGIARSWARYDANTLLDEIEAPLYIGGLPDSAPSGTLKIKENFKGCLKKLKVGEVIMDWTDMEELNRISLDSCPSVD